MVVDLGPPPHPHVLYSIQVKLVDHLILPQHHAPQLSLARALLHSLGC